MIEAGLGILVLSFFQNAASAMSSRSRNRDNRWYHVCCATASNALWFFTMSAIVLSGLDPIMVIPYLIGTVAGSMSGAEISMWIEKRINAKT